MADSQSNEVTENAFQPKLHVVLYEPQIPQNTGNVGRTCVALNAKLWLVRPLGFRMDAARLRRAGLDYWEHLEWEAVDNWEALETRFPNKRFWLFSRKGEVPYYQADFQAGDVLVFGSETQGLPDRLLDASDRCLTIPMPGDVRSLNLACSAGIAMYEAYRQMESA